MTFLLAEASLGQGVPVERLDLKPGAAISEALQEGWRWVRFTAEDGLPEGNEQQVVETGDGGIWVTAGESVAWFDSYRWRRIGCREMGDKGVTWRIEALGRDRVLATGNGRMVVFQRGGCERVRVRHEGKELAILASSPDRDGRVLLWGADHNIYSWDGVSGTVTELLYRGGEIQNQGAVEMRGNPVFVAGREGLMRIDPGGAKLAIGLSGLAKPEQLQGLQIRGLARNRRGQGVFALGFPEQWAGLWEWNGMESAVRKVRPEVGTPRLLAMNDEGDIVGMVNGTEGWLREKGKWKQLWPVPAALRSASSMKFDSQGRLWVCTDQGIWMMQGNLKRWSRLKFRSPDERNRVTAMLAARDGSLWAGTADGVLIVKADGSVRTVREAAGRKLGVTTGLAEDREGGIWCSSGATFEGLMRYYGGKWKWFGPGEGLPATVYDRVQVDGQGRVWALATGRWLPGAVRGAFLYQGGRFEAWDETRGLKDSRLYSVATGPGGEIWFGGVSAISRFDGQQWRHWTRGEGLRESAAFDLEIQKSGVVHFVDRRNGLGVIGRDGVLKYEAVGASAAAQGTWGLLRDPDGHEWVSSRGGLLLRRSGVWNTIGPGVGLENPELWPLALWRNQVCMGTDGSGIYCLDRSVLSGPGPRIEVLAPRIEGKIVELAWRVTSHVDAAGAEGKRGRYRVDGGEWSAWSERGQARVSGLRSGRHRIEFEAMDFAGTRSDRVEAIEVGIAAPAYAQPALLIPTALSVVVAMVAIGMFVQRTYAHNRQLAEKEESFRALIEYSSLGITLRDRNQRIFYVSPAVRIILGYEPEELLGDFRGDLVHPEDLAAVQARMATLMENPGQTQRAKVRLKHKNGEYRWVESITRNLFEDPSVRAIVTNLRDVTDSTNAEIAAAEAREKAERANQAKSEFLAMISHEIRTPMNGITGMCQLLLESRLNREQQDYANTIAQSAQSLLALINDVLDFSRIEAGKLSIERAPLDLAALLEEVAQLMRVRAGEKGIRLEVTYPGDAPRAFYGDELRIRQILYNLTGNAVKFTHEGKIVLKAEIEYQCGSRYAVKIGVKDTGIGIAAEKLQNVFKKFTQADISTTRRYGGSGLGLAISRSLAELMGGTIQAESVPGEGSTFTVMLQMDAAPETSLQRRESPADGLQPLPEPLEVLLVEDNKINQKLALRLLERLGCTVWLAENGLEALEALDRRPVDLILMDCQMPEMDGFEATRKIREREHGHVPIIAVTANAMESDFERCLASGMDSFLTKPIDFAKLREALETWGIDSRAPGAISDRDVS
ncbi:MAG: response regulator [Acidobacteriota bacterium]